MARSPFASTLGTSRVERFLRRDAAAVAVPTETGNAVTEEAPAVAEASSGILRLVGMKVPDGFSKLGAGFYRSADDHTIWALRVAEDGSFELVRKREEPASDLRRVAECPSCDGGVEVEAGPTGKTLAQWALATTMLGGGMKALPNNHDTAQSYQQAQQSGPYRQFQEQGARYRGRPEAAQQRDELVNQGLPSAAVRAFEDGAGLPRSGARRTAVISGQEYVDEIEKMAQGLIEKFIDEDGDYPEDASNGLDYDGSVHAAIDGHQWIIYNSYHDDVIRAGGHQDVDVDDYFDMSSMTPDEVCDKLQQTRAFVGMKEDVMSKADELIGEGWGVWKLLKVGDYAEYNGETWRVTEAPDENDPQADYAWECVSDASKVDDSFEADAMAEAIRDTTVERVDAPDLDAVAVANTTPIAPPSLNAPQPSAAMDPLRVKALQQAYDAGRRAPQGASGKGAYPSDPGLADAFSAGNVDARGFGLMQTAPKQRRLVDIGPDGFGKWAWRWDAPEPQQRRAFAHKGDVFTVAQAFQDADGKPIPRGATLTVKATNVGRFNDVILTDGTHDFIVEPKKLTEAYQNGAIKLPPREAAASWRRDGP